MSTLDDGGVLIAAPARTRPGLSWWGNRSVTTKILANVGVAAVVAGGIGVLGMVSMSKASDDSALLYSSNLLGSVEAAKLDGLLSQMRVGVRDVLLASDDQEAAAKTAKLVDLREQFATTVKAYEATGMDPKRRVLVDDLNAQFTTYTTAQDQVLAPLAAAHD